jgi:cytochrome P450
VEDSDYWDELFSRHTRHDKYKWAAHRFGTEQMLFTTPEHDLHATRRAALNPMFSKRSIAKLGPFLKERVELLCTRVLAAEKSGEVLNLIDVFTAFTGDVIMEYCFGFCDNQLGSPGFKTNFHEAFVNLTSFGTLLLQFPFLNPVSNHNAVTPS